MHLAWPMSVPDSLFYFHYNHYSSTMPTVGPCAYAHGYNWPSKVVNKYMPTAAALILVQLMELQHVYGGYSLLSSTSQYQGLMWLDKPLIMYS